MNCAETLGGYFWFGLILGVFLGHLLAGSLFHNRRMNDASDRVTDNDNNAGSEDIDTKRDAAPVSAASATEIGADE